MTSLQLCNVILAELQTCDECVTSIYKNYKPTMGPFQTTLFEAFSSYCLVFSNGMRKRNAQELFMCCVLESTRKLESWRNLDALCKRVFGDKQAAFPFSQ